MRPKAQEGREQGTARALGCLGSPSLTHTTLLLWVHEVTGQSCRGDEEGSLGQREQSLRSMRQLHLLKAKAAPTNQLAAGVIYGRGDRGSASLGSHTTWTLGAGMAECSRWRGKAGCHQEAFLQKSL